LENDGSNGAGDNAAKTGYDNVIGCGVQWLLMSAQRLWMLDPMATHLLDS
jgi:hypothetical protein